MVRGTRRTRQFTSGAEVSGTRNGGFGGGDGGRSALASRVSDCADCRNPRPSHINKPPSRARPPRVPSLSFLTLLLTCDSPTDATLSSIFRPETIPSAISSSKQTRSPHTQTKPIKSNFPQCLPRRPRPSRRALLPPRPSPARTLRIRYANSRLILFFYCVSTANTLQAMITDAIVAVIHPPHFFFLECSAHFWWLFGHSMGDA